MLRASTTLVTESNLGVKPAVYGAVSGERLLVPVFWLPGVGAVLAAGPFVATLAGQLKGQSSLVGSQHWAVP